MRAVATCAAAAVLMAVTLPAGAAAETPPALTVRLYNASGIPASVLSAARLAAGSILRETGLGVRFRHCGRPLSPDAPVDPCDDSLTRAEVVVRIIAAPAFNPVLHPDAYGVAYVVQATNRGWLATVFSDRIDQAAARVGVEPGILLGRVVAHEVGHLLLGSGYHGAAGVMRADWPDALLARGQEDWRFSTIEAARMHHLLASLARDSLARAAGRDGRPTNSTSDLRVSDTFVASMQ